VLDGPRANYHQKRFFENSFPEPDFKNFSNDIALDSSRKAQ
jgi:hypothetical protein